MNSRELKLSQRALQDITSRARILKQARGVKFAEAYATQLIGWLQQIAANGARLGTAIADNPNLTAFSYRRQATILVEITDDEMRIVRIYFRGQDWSKP